jgi:YgiT-type zinc finger domain-containing protein
MELSACPLCGSKRLACHVEDYVTRRRGKRIEVRGLEVYRCPRCGEGFLTDAAMQRIEQVARRRRAA